MAKKAAPQHVEPEEESQEAPDFDGSATREEGNTSKADMVRAAVAAGMESPEEGVKWIKATYGIDLPKPMWSSYISQQKARERKAAGGESTPKPRAVNQPQGFSGIPAGFGADIKQVKQLIETAGGGDQLKDLAGSIGALVQKYGVAGLNDLIDAFE